MKKFMILSVVGLLLSACHRDNNGSHSAQKKDYPTSVPFYTNDQDDNEPIYNDGSHSDADWQITLNVKKVIMTDTQIALRARFVSVSTKNGVVTLTGTVASREDAKIIESRAKNVPGVKSVNNQLIISQ